MTVGERIRNRRKELNMTQEELAKKLNYKNKSAICRVEKDYEQNLTLDRVSAFAKALGVTEAYLMGWEENLKKFGEEVREKGYVFDVLHIAEDEIINEEVQRKSLLIMAYLSQLNEEGFLEATKRIGELAELPKYRKN